MNLIEVMKRFPDQESCIDHLERIRWRGKPVCPHCGCVEVVRKKEEGVGRVGRWHCSACKASFKVTHGTVFHGTKIPLQKWFLAISLILNAKKGLSSYQLQRDLDLNQKTAWYILTRIRAEMSKKGGTLLQGIVEADETYIGGRPRKENKKEDRNDGGVDGRIYFPEGDELKAMKLEVKGTKIIRPESLRALAGIIDEQDFPLGGFITLTTPKRVQRQHFEDFCRTKGTITIDGKEYPRLQVLYIEEILEGKRFNTPLVRGKSTTDQLEMEIL